jgi:2'-5' RNA ligase
MMTEFFIALTPEKELYDKVKELKLRLFKTVGERIYLLDPPHLTLCVGNADDKNIDMMFTELEMLARIKSNIDINLIGWLIFYNDPATQKNFLCLKLDEPSVHALRHVQLEVLKILARHKSDENALRYNDIKNFNAAQQSALVKYGYPYVGEGWIPHIGICPLDDDELKNALDDTDVTQFTKHSRMAELSLYTVHDDKPTLVKSFKV